MAEYQRLTYIVCLQDAHVNCSGLGEGVAAAADFRPFDAAGETEVFSFAAAGTIVHAHESPLVLGDQRVAGIAGRQGAEDFDDARFAHARPAAARAAGG